MREKGRPPPPPPPAKHSLQAPSSQGPTLGWVSGILTPPMKIILFGQSLSLGFFTYRVGALIPASERRYREGLAATMLVKDKKLSCLPLLPALLSSRGSACHPARGSQARSLSFPAGGLCHLPISATSGSTAWVVRERRSRAEGTGQHLLGENPQWVLKELAYLVSYQMPHCSIFRNFQPREGSRAKSMPALQGWLYKYRPSGSAALPSIQKHPSSPPCWKHVGSEPRAALGRAGLRRGHCLLCPQRPAPAAPHMFPVSGEQWGRGKDRK